MERDAKLQFAGKEYSLMLTGAASFAAQELLTEDEALTDVIYDNTPAGWARLCQLVGIMAEQGELVRRFYGHAPQEMLDVKKLELLASLLETVQIRGAAMDALLKAYKREEQDENEEVDLGLAEHQKKSE